MTNQEATSYRLSISGLQEQLKYTQERIRELRERFPEDELVRISSIASLERMEEKLREDIDTELFLQSSADLQMVITGNPVIENKIDADFVGKLISGVQNLYYSVMQLSTGKTTDRSSIPEQLKESGRLYIEAFVPGSFGIWLSIEIEKEKPQMPLSDRCIVNSQEVLDSLFQALGSRRNDTTLFANSRIAKHYSEVMSIVSKSSAGIAFRRRTHPQDHFKINYRDAAEWIGWYQRMKEEAWEESIEGTLIGGDIEKAKFSIRHGEEVLDGGVSEKALATMKRIALGSRVKVRMRRTLITHEDNLKDPKYKDTIESFEGVPGDNLPLF